MNPLSSGAVSRAELAAPACDDMPADDGCNEREDAVYDEMEALLQDPALQDGLPRRGCVELAQALEDVMALLMPPASEFSDPRTGSRPMGAAPGPR